jgi:hypothetical protein
MAVNVKVKENEQFSKKVGFFEAKVVALNPTVEELIEMGIDMENKTEIEYLTEKDDVKTLRLSFWLQDVKTKLLFNLNFFLKDEIVKSKNGMTLFINNIGNTAYADSEENVPSFLLKYSNKIRPAHLGEKELYSFIKAYLKNVRYDEDSELDLEFNKMMKEDLSEIKKLLKNEEFTGTVVCLATIVVREKDGETKEYQSIYSREFLSGYYMKNLRNKKYSAEDIQKLKTLKATPKPDGKKRYLPAYEEFILNISNSEYGCKDFYALEEIKDYNPNDNFAASSSIIKETNDDDDTY